VGVDVVRELYGVMATKGAAGGFVVTSGRFTDDANGFATGRNVRDTQSPRAMGSQGVVRRDVAMWTPECIATH
jgi:restriction system protein